MVTDDELRKEYAEIFDNIHAGDELKNRILNQHPKKKRYPKPFIASAATVAAGIMIFAAVHNVTFDRSGNDDVISETVTTVDGTKPEKTPFAAASGSEQADNTNDQPADGAQQEKTSDNVANNAKTKKVEAAAGSGESAAASSGSESKTSEQLEKEALAEANSTYKKAESSVNRNSGSSRPSGNTSQSSGSVGQYTAPSYSYKNDNASGGSLSSAEENNTAENNGAENAPEAAAQSSAADDAKTEAEIGSRASTDTGSSSGTASSSMPAHAGAGGGVNAQHSGSMPMVSSALADMQEMWDNDRYFNYIGKDIIACIESVRGFSYIGEDGGYFTVDETGEIYDDTRTFEFSNGKDTLILTSTTNTAIAGAYMQSSDYEKRNINGKEAAILAQDNKYECYMIDGNVLYIIEVCTSDSGVFEDVIMSL